MHRLPVYLEKRSLSIPTDRPVWLMSPQRVSPSLTKEYRQTQSDHDEDHDRDGDSNMLPYPIFKRHASRHLREYGWRR